MLTECCASLPPCRKSTLRWLPSCRSCEEGCRSVWWAALTTLRLLSSWERGMKVRGATRASSTFGVGVEEVGSS